MKSNEPASPWVDYSLPHPLIAYKERNKIPDPHLFDPHLFHTVLQQSLKIDIRHLSIDKGDFPIVVNVFCFVANGGMLFGFPQ